MDLVVKWEGVNSVSSPLPTPSPPPSSPPFPFSPFLLPSPHFSSPFLPPSPAVLGEGRAAAHVGLRSSPHGVRMQDVLLLWRD